MVSVHLSHLWTFTWRKVSFGCLQSNTTRPTIAIVTSPRLLDTIWYTTTSRQQERADLVNDVSFYFLKFWTDSPLRCVICFSLLQIGKNHAFNVQFSSYFFFKSKNSFEVQQKHNHTILLKIVSVICFLILLWFNINIYCNNIWNWYRIFIKYPKCLWKYT